MKKWVYTMMAVLMAMVVSVQAQVEKSADTNAPSFGKFAGTLPTENLSVLETANFQIQNHDISVMVTLRPIMDNSSTKNHLVVRGCHVAVLLSDLFEMAAPPQCHWDGVNEKSRYCFTLFYRLRTPIEDDQKINEETKRKKESIMTYSFNLLDFASTYTSGEWNTQITRMGVNPEDGIVKFRSASTTDIDRRSNVREIASRFEY